MMGIVAFLPLCGFLAAICAGCGGGAGYGGGADANAERARLRGLLGEARNLPDGFSARPRDGWRAPFRSADEDCRLVLDAAAAGSAQAVAGVRVAVTYQGDRVGELAGVGLTSYAGDTAERRFAELTRALGDCAVVKGGVAGRSTTFTVSPLDLRGVGGDVQARRLSGRLNGYPYEMHLVFALSGHTVVSLVHTGMAAVDVERTRQLTRFLVGRTAA
ncbi:hypothetical protein FHS43_003433 [Streptosporangium becharense]|uniref:Lipoprotein n=2 Tax=Streptosporangium becharense TaxID=1816182 RepID=A0A7W9IDH5_9ACTN|nr:hypothetical protein [Streptosporangium becharense]MBB2912153.1 hypothetical protein [Streptosporangium becharense]MBB5818700.1 hypothetical protein [Streptosporangium becharense]